MLPCESRSGASRKSVKVLLILIKDEKEAGSSLSLSLSLSSVAVGTGKLRKTSASSPKWLLSTETESRRCVGGGGKNEN